VLQEFLAADLPSVLGVRAQLQQVALNLIMNGVEAMADLSDRSRELVIRSQRQELDGGPGVVVAVQDAGPGIADEIRDHLFEPFYSTKSHGLGMGLSISRSIIQTHGGRLWATANAGPGATFQFVLPARSDPGP
jgi:signal transduction histidine kinase